MFLSQLLHEFLIIQLIKLGGILNWKDYDMIMIR